MTTDGKQIVFLAHAIPPLRDGTYLVDAAQTIPAPATASYGAKVTLVVSGERFTIRGTEIDSVFPPNNATGEFDGVLPHVVFTRTTLPWERTLDTPKSSHTYPNAPWLAVLVCDAAHAPPLQSVTAKDLVQQGTAITVFDTPGVTGTGTLTKEKLSYGAALLGELEYGETPDDACQVIDLDATLFSQIAPAATDLAYLAHVREVDAPALADDGTPTETKQQFAVAIANRLVPVGDVRAYLVSLEGMADYLPALDGTPSAAIPSGTTLVRLIVYQSWTFTANDDDESLQALLENLDTPPPNTARNTTLSLPLASPPSAPRIATALANLAAGALANDDATVIVQNALLMGYVPLDHHVRRGGATVSWYRGPLSPLPVLPLSPAYYAGADAAYAYDPRSGLFDASYAAAWQIGQLLALQSVGMANQLYQWKRSVRVAQAVAAEQALFATRLADPSAFTSLRTGAARLRDDSPTPPLPDDVIAWFVQLARLEGVPFNYLVPDERMLPPESIRFFYLDANWIDALVDGAFSIGRAGVSPDTLFAATALEAVHAPRIRALARRSLLGDSGGGTTKPITGCLIRSLAVSGWPNLRIVAFSDAAATAVIEPVRVLQLSADTMMALFADEVHAVYVREPPEALHHGLEPATGGGYQTTLRSVVGGPNGVPPGKQYGASDVQKLTTRADGLTLIVTTAAQTLQTTLTTKYQQQLANGVTAAEFALELTKGVVEVEFSR